MPNLPNVLEVSGMLPHELHRIPLQDNIQPVARLATTQVSVSPDWVHTDGY
jgi:hypothetical protein